jgi:hypothetical protein
MDDQGNPIVPAGDQQQVLDEANLVLDEVNLVLDEANLVLDEVNPVLDEAEANPDIMGEQQHQNIRMANYKLPMFNGTRDTTMAHRAKLFLMTWIQQ